MTYIFPDTEKGKHIEIWPRGWPHYVWDPEDMRDSWSFVTIQPDSQLEIKHEVDRDKIAAAGLKKGEKYRAALTNKYLGTKWWMFGSLDDAEGMRFKQWRAERQGDKEEGDKEEGDEEEREGEDKNAPSIMGENPHDLALVIEKGEAEFEIA